MRKSTQLLLKNRYIYDYRPFHKTDRLNGGGQTVSERTVCQLWAAAPRRTHRGARGSTSLFYGGGRCRFFNCFGFLPFDSWSAGARTAGADERPGSEGLLGIQLGKVLQMLSVGEIEAKSAIVLVFYSWALTQGWDSWRGKYYIKLLFNSSDRYSRGIDSQLWSGTRLCRLLRNTVFDSTNWSLK